MGVSGGSDVDLGLLVNGGEAFVNRMAELKAATESYTKALNDLSLGKEALAARDEASRALAEANEQRKAATLALEKEINGARESLSAWAEETKAKTMAAYNEANQLLAEAKNKQEASSAANSAALRCLDETKANAASLIKDAEAKAAEIIANAEYKAKDILSVAAMKSDEAKAALAAANETKAKYEAAINSIKSAASHIGG
jgi:hypothetical protein